MSATLRLPLTLAFALTCTAAADAAGVPIAVVAPTDGPFAALGQQIREGAVAKINADGNTPIIVNEPCSAEGDNAAVQAQIAQAKAAVAIGFLCSETLEATLPALKEAGVPAITVSVRATILMEDTLKNGWPLFRLAPSDNAEAARIIDFILSEWSGQPLGLIEDGTIHGRELTEAIRNALEDKGLKPAFIDTYRPGQEQQIGLVRRLSKAGVTRVFVGGDRSDVAIIARDARAEGIELDLLGGDAMNAANQPLPLADGVRAVTLPDWSADPRNTELVKAFRNANVEPEGYVMPGYAAATIANAALGLAAGENRPLIEALTMKAFDTTVGPVRFTDRHELTENPYKVLEWRGDRFVTPAPKTD
ncbi:MAG: branched-chain amino acid ABC transporter substrate-binding protein [Rhizobiales bacterium 63-7]|nr:ABC transporter substrate-binding protein [Hyphomicrobiales bacterium]OJU66906.1 MAG: branched-chain amino acid ABC transporter substrate-binding protein [Rhizobiales bacterium 63-7]